MLPWLVPGLSCLQAWNNVLPCFLQVKKEFAAIDKAKVGDPSTPFAATKSTSTKVNCELNKGLSLPANAASIFQVHSGSGSLSGCSCPLSMHVVLHASSTGPLAVSMRSAGYCIPSQHPTVMQTDAAWHPMCAFVTAQLS